LPRGLIVGYGNPSRCDDGVGPRAAEALSASLQSADVEVVSCQQLTPDLAQPLSCVQLAVFIDAACHCPAGSLQCRRLTSESKKAFSGGAAFSHFQTPESLLAWSEELYGGFPEAYCLSVGAASLAEGLDLSSAVQAALPQLQEKVRSLLEAVLEGSCK
jgi:hydrogenase maturation protease